MKTIVWINLMFSLTLFYYGCGENPISPEEAEKGKEPELTWVIKPMLPSVQYHYSSGIFIGCTVYKYFEVTGGSGEVEITAVLANKKTKKTFFVEEGKSYRISIVVAVSRYDPVAERRFQYNLIISSPSAASPTKVIIKGIDADRPGVSLGKPKLQPLE